MIDRLLELLGICLRLGTTAFGGPAAHIAMMEAEFVRKRNWLSSEEFVDLIGASNLVPGPSSTEVMLHIGYRRSGILGLIVAGIAFIGPAAILVCCLASGYQKFGSLEAFTWAFHGIKPVVVAIVGQAIYLLASKTLNTWPKRSAFGLNLGASWFGVAVLPLLFGSGITFGVIESFRERSLKSAKPVANLFVTVFIVAALPIGVASIYSGPKTAEPISLFLYFLKLGSVIYGSGYVLLAFLEQDIVASLHWLTKGQLVDAIAIGQFTPGPVFTTATFIGFLKAGVPGALVSTLGIFLPAFLFVALTGKNIQTFRKSPIASSFLDGINASALALMTVVAIRLGVDALSSIAAVGIFVVSLALLLRFKTNSALLIGVGGILGVVLHQSFHPL